jgi:hypothetical protein
MRNLFIIGLLGSLAMPAWAGPAIEVYKSPTCGCCNKWIDHLKQNDFNVVSRDVDDVVPYKYRYGVPYGMGSCHTARVAGYTIEGHVPAREIKRLLAERPKDARGLVVPGMPQGSPGMESMQSDIYEVMLFDGRGRTSTYAKY